MRFGLIHRLMTDAIAVLGILALVTSGELGRWMAGAVLAGLTAALAVPESAQSHPWMRRLSTVAPIVLLVVQFARLFTGASVLELAVEFAAALQIIRLATRRGAAHDQQVIVLALLHLIAGTVIGGGLGYGLCFLGFLVIAPGALVLSHLRREVEGNYRQGARDRTGLPVDVPRILRSRRVVDRSFLFATCLLSIPIFWFTAGLFVLFPRVGLSFLLLSKPHGGRMVGFSEHVDLGEVGTLRTDPTIALRVEIPQKDLPNPPSRLAMHLRGAAFDTYDGHSWSRSQTQHDLATHEGGILWIRRAPDPPRDHVWHIDLEPIDPPVLFAPLGAVGMQVRQRGDPVLNPRLEIWAESEGAFRYNGSDERGVRYDVYIGSDYESGYDALSAADLERYTALPRSLSDRVRRLAHQVVREGATTFEKAHTIETFLRRSFTYDLNSPAGKSADPLDDFLFTSRRGHCEFYSTAMVVLLRELRVPARNVTGFIGGSYNRFGHYYAVRQGDAHSWVEVFLPEHGWQTFDPTPPAESEPRSELSGMLAFVRDIIEATGQRWDRYVVGYDLRQQVYLFESISRFSSTHVSPLLAKINVVRELAIAALVAIAAWYFLWRRKKTRPKAPGQAPDDRARERIIATALYELLESAMSAQGIPRGASTPPLRHAEFLKGMNHPLADEVLELTELYLGARFGGVSITDDDRRSFETRVRRVRAVRTMQAQSATG
jgi:transglutaminase-like putative cysteine protease